MSDERGYPLGATNDERREELNDGLVACSSIVGHRSLVADVHCVSCSDEAFEARVVRVEQASGMALVAVENTTTEVDISLVDEVVPGDLLLIHGGVAISKL